MSWNFHFNYHSPFVNKYSCIAEMWAESDPRLLLKVLSPGMLSQQVLNFDSHSGSGCYSVLSNWSSIQLCWELAVIRFVTVKRRMQRIASKLSLGIRWPVEEKE